MSLEAALAAENNAILTKLGVPSTRGRSLSPSKIVGHSHLRSTSRGRSSSRRRRNSSRARSQGDDVDYKWSILNHDPSERFRAKRTRKKVEKKIENSNDNDNANDEDEDDEDEDYESDEISEEEQISDDEADFEFDINEIVLPNFKISINDYYKKRSGTAFASNYKKDQSMEQIELNRKYKEDLLKKKSEELRALTEVLSLKKAIGEAQYNGSDIPQSTIDRLSTKLKELGIKEFDRMRADEVEDLEAKKDKAYKEYKKLIIEKSKENKTPSVDTNQNVDLKRKLTKGDLSISEDNLRVSRTLTLGDFFQSDLSSNKKSSDVDSYLIYLDLSPDSLNAIQYTIGTIVKSGDVLYVINSVDDEDDIEYFKKQCEKLTEMVSTYLNLISDENFKIHVVIETTHHYYPKHFLNELIKILKPNLFIVGYKLLLSELTNYISSVPILVVKKRTKRRASSVGQIKR